MIYCDHCWKNVSGLRVDDGPLCCSECGKVLEDYHFSQEPTFVKNAAGQSKLSGHYVRTIQKDFSASRQRTLDKTYDDIKYLSFNLGVNDDNMAKQALGFYTIALERNFTKGRKSELVQAACLYIAFRANKKPYLLIEFSNYLRTNVYVLGAVFLQLCKVLRLEEHPIIQKPVDPSLFIYKNVINLLKQRNVPVCDTAESIVDIMKRNWMQTGRKPSGLCGAALYVSANAHGFKCSKSDILKIVHVCEATLTKRLVEFANTESANLTIDELNKMTKELEENPIKIPDGELNKCFSKDLLCEHRNSAVPYFALGLCEACYKDFDKLSGGLGGGLDPPAFQRAERVRMAKSHSELVKVSNDACERQIEELHASEPESIGANVHMATHDESESLSDIDDQEVDGYLCDEEGKNSKKISFDHLYPNYHEEQAAKEAAAAKPRKRRSQEAKNFGPAESAEEATRQMLRAKRFSHKVNFDRLKELYDEPVSPENPKKVQFELHCDNDDNFESKLEDNIKDDELGSGDEFEDGDMDGEYENTLSRKCKQDM